MQTDRHYEAIAFPNDVKALKKPQICSLTAAEISCL